MADTKHTPGPWQVKNGFDGATIVIANVDGESFADGTASYSFDFIADTTDEFGDAVDCAPANARLIAAAPELLSVLTAIHEQLVKQGINFGPLIADAEAAIAKATA